MAATRMSIYAAISLLLAVMGCYAVGAFSVARRTQEIGIRMTLGATRGDILQHGAYPDRPHDRNRPGRGARASHRSDAGDVARALQCCLRRATTFVALTALLAASALLAGYIPAYRAARIDPMAALRNE